MLAEKEKLQLFFESLEKINIEINKENTLYGVINKVIGRGDINIDLAFIILLYLNDEYQKVMSDLQLGTYDESDLVNIIMDDQYVDANGISNLKVRIYFVYRFLIESYPSIGDDFIYISSLSENEIKDYIGEKIKKS